MSDSHLPSKDRPARKLLRHRIEKQLKRQAEEQRKELLRRRIEIAKEGAKLHQMGNMIDSMKKYQQYLFILEMWKKCGRDGLTPDYFDPKRDMYEMVLISGIYWDMAKLYDKAKRVDQKAELDLSIKKFILFSKGYPYQPMSAEALRRFINSGKCKHKSDFKKAYQTLTGEKCFVVTSLIDLTQPKTLVVLRKYRDEKLNRSSYGRAFIRVYYKSGPTIAAGLDRAPQPIRKSAAWMIDRIAEIKSISQFSADEN